MVIPKEILDVARPKNTVVYCYGKDEIKYGVKKRVGCIRKDGRNLPVNGETVEHIINGKYVPIDEKKKLSSFEYDVRDWANIIFLDRIFSPMMDELLTHYHKDDALKIYCASLLRVAYPGIKNGELKEAYESSFLSIVRSRCALSKNVVSSFLHDLGKSYSLIVAFMRNRVNSCSSDARLLIDGTLKSNESKINSLSDFSRKAIKKGSKDISIVYCYDLEKKEPVCSKCYPSNMLDVYAYSNFIEENGVTKGMIIADKGFPSSAASSHFENNPNLHYLNPIKRNSKLIERHSMFSFE